MFFYKFNDKLLFSSHECTNLDSASEGDLAESREIVYFLIDADPATSRRSYSLSDPSLFNLEEEGVNLLQMQSINTVELPNWVINKIENRRIKVINTSYPKWKEALVSYNNTKWRVNVIGLGDVGGTLVSGLRLLGGDCISSIGIYDLDMDKTKRWEYEISQISDFNKIHSYPEVLGINRDKLFDCDMFIFCISVGVPPIGEDAADVRMAQFEGNSRIVNLYAREAREKNFKGIFSVVSDPVDLLCKSAYLSSNRDSSGKMDFLGLAPEQIRGYGLGVMNARAIYYAKQNNWIQYLKEGRVFGPHGEGLIAADSINNYNDKISTELTEMVKNANIEVRKTGFKPYIAPAFSSGSLSIINTIKGEWHYSSNFMGGVYMGALNRLLDTGIEIEQLHLDDKLLNRLAETYKRLENTL